MGEDRMGQNGREDIEWERGYRMGEDRMGEMI
jgi:hypothetical protein